MACLIDAEDFAEYEVVDSDGNINLLDNCTFCFDSMIESANSYVYKDYGEGYFGDFEHNFEFEITNNVVGFVSIWALDNGAGRKFWGHNIHDRQITEEGLDLYIKEGSVAGKFSLFLIDYEKQMWDQSIDLDLNTTYYLRITRSFYPKYLNVSIYNNYLRRDHIDLVGKIGCYCNNTHYQYIVPLSSHQAQTGFSLVSGCVANLQIQNASFSSSSSSSSSSFSSSSSSSSSRSSSSSSSSRSSSSSSRSSSSSSSSSSLPSSSSSSSAIPIPPRYDASPNSDVAQGGWTLNGGKLSMWETLGDRLDSTYIDNDDTEDTVKLGFYDPLCGSGTYDVHVDLRLRRMHWNLDFTCSLYANGVLKATKDLPVGSGSILSYLVIFEGLTFTDLELSTLQVWLTPNDGAAGIRLMELALIFIEAQTRSWHKCLNDSFWMGNSINWDGSKWTTDFNSTGYLYAKSEVFSWVKPTKMRITIGSGGFLGLSPYYATESFNAGVPGTYEVNVFPFAAIERDSGYLQVGDFYYFSFDARAAVSTITNIEFYYENRPSQWSKWLSDYDAGCGLTAWGAVTGTWMFDHFESSGGVVELVASADYFEISGELAIDNMGHRPTQIQITANSASITLVELTDSDSNIIASYSGAASSVVTLDITYVGTEYIYGLNIESSGGEFNITDIEFFERETGSVSASSSSTSSSSSSFSFSSSSSSSSSFSYSSSSSFSLSVSSSSSSSSYAGGGTYTTAANSDDAFTQSPNAPTFRDLTTEFAFGQGTVNVYEAFIRFSNVSIPVGASLTSAIVRMVANSGLSGDTCNINVYFEASDDPAAPTTKAQYDARTMTSGVPWNSVAHTVAGTSFDTPDLSTALQEVINRPGWNPGQHVIVYLKNNASSTPAYRNGKANNGALNYTQLIVTWNM